MRTPAFFVVVKQCCGDIIDEIERITDMSFERITQDPKIMGGKPCIRGMRVTVGMIIGQIAGGATIDELLADYPYLEREDIHQALSYAALLVQGHDVDLVAA